MMILGEFLSVLIVVPTGLQRLVYSACGDEDAAALMTMYLNFIGIWVAAAIFILAFRSNRPMLRAWAGSGGRLKGFLLGLLFGFGCNALCVLASWLMGDIKLEYAGFDLKLLALFLLVVTIQSGAEEITYRLYLYQKLRRRYRNPLVAILGNAAVFMALHLANPGFTALAGLQIFIIGVVFSMLIYYYDSLWCAIAFHTAWNFTQNIIFGLPNSGMVSSYSIFRLDAASARNGLFYNVGFGVEGSIGACAALLIFGAVLYMRNRGRGEKDDVWMETEMRICA